MLTVYNTTDCVLCDIRSEAKETVECREYNKVKFASNGKPRVRIFSVADRVGLTQVPELWILGTINVFR